MKKSRDQNFVIMVIVLLALMLMLLVWMYFSYRIDKLTFTHEKPYNAFLA